MADFTENLGIEMLRMADGQCVMELELAEFHMSMASRAHGGVRFSMLDTALGRAVISKLPEGRAVPLSRPRSTTSARCSVAASAPTPRWCA